MEDNQKYNKRPRSYTEFRSSYSDNKKNYDKGNQTAKKQLVLKIIFAAVILAGFVLAGFLITDALLTISEEPYVPSEETSQTQKADIDEKYFENQVTVPADEIEENGNNNDMKE